MNGCSWFLPPHPNSEDREGERVYIKMIESCNDFLVASERVHYYEAVFGEPCLDAKLYEEKMKLYEEKMKLYEEKMKLYEEKMKLYEEKMKLYEEKMKLYEEKMKLYEEMKIQPFSFVALGTLGAAAVVAAVGLTVDFAVDQLKEEAKRYEAQWQQRIAKGDFWTAVKVIKEKTGVQREKVDLKNRKTERQETQKTLPEQKEWRQKYVGFAVCRVTKDTIKRQPDDVTGNNSVNPESDPCSTTSASAAKIVFAIAPSPDEKFFLIAPLSFQITKTKAKVLSDRPWTFIPPFIVGKLIDYDGHSIDVDVSIEMTAYSINEKNQGVVAPIAAETFKISDYDVQTNDTLTPENGLQAQPIGWLCRAVQFSLRHRV